MSERFEHFIIMYDIVQTGIHGDVEAAMHSFGDVNKKHMPAHSVHIRTHKQYTANELYIELSHNKKFRSTGVYHLLIVPIDHPFHAGEVNIDHSNEFRSYKQSYSEEDLRTQIDQG